MKQVSIKQSKRLREYSKARKEYLLENEYCAVCGGIATQIHHIQGKIGDLLCDKNNLLAVCFPCHRRIEDNPAWAKENGYSKNRNKI